MSNRAKWAHWNRGKRGSHRARIPVGLGLAGVGGVLVIAALEGMRDGRFMFPTFSFRLGTLVIGQTLGLLCLGVIFVIAGVAALFIG
jgi:hypothetical protein